MSLQYATRITARERGDFLIERLCQNVVVDRYTTGDLRAPRRNREPWIQRASGWCSALPGPAPLLPAQQPHWLAWAEHVRAENQWPPAPAVPLSESALQASAEALA